MATQPCLFSVCTKNFTHEKAQAEKQGLLKYAHVFGDHYAVEVNPSQKQVIYDLTHRVWSPSCFKDGVRREANFLYSSVIGLDFDGSLNLGDALKVFAPYRHIIGTTRSHTEKAHRFRVLLKLDRVIREREEYRRVLDYYIRRFDSDRACKDCARFYYPCTKIVSLKPGHLLTTSLRPKKTAPKNTKPKVKAFARHIEDFLYMGVPFGAGRNQAIFVTSIILKERGFCLRDIFQMIDGSPFERTGFSDRELLRTVQSAWGRRA